MIQSPIENLRKNVQKKSVQILSETLKGSPRNLSKIFPAVHQDYYKTFARVLKRI